jgi:MFS family permease
MGTASGTSPTGLDRAQRRLLLGVCVIGGGGTIVPATYNYMLRPMLLGLGADESQYSFLRQIPSIAGVLVIFLAAVLGGRWGARRVITAGCVLFTVGSGMVLLSSTLLVAVLGLVLQNVGMSALFVVALALLSAQISTPDSRATAFSMFAVVGPVVYLVAPLAAGLLIDSTSWRLVAALWGAGGLLMITAARRLLPVDDAERQPAELLTAALAGLVLALAIQTVNAISSNGWSSPSALLRAGGTAAAVTALTIVYRRSPAPSLSLAALRQGGMLVLLAVVVVIPFANLWFYLTIGYQQVFGLGTLQTALVMVPAQLSGIAGAMLAGAALRTWGVTATGTGALVAMAAAVASTWVIWPDSPLVVPVGVMCVFGLASTAVAVPLTNAIMDSAPPGEEGGAAAFRGAAANLGNALGVVVMTSLVFTVVSSSLQDSLRAQGLAGEGAAAIAGSIRDGVSSESVASHYSVPLEDVDAISAEQREAMADGLHALGTTGAVLISGCAGLFLIGRRRQARSRA